MQAAGLGLFGLERAGAIEHDARAHPITLNTRPAQHRRRVAQAAFGLQALTGGLEHGYLLLGGGGVQLVGAGKVAHQHDARDLAAGQQALVGVVVVLGVDADAVHAGVHLQPQGQRLAHWGLFDRLELPRRVHHAPQVVLGDQRQLAGLEKAFEQQHRGLDAGCAQFQRFLDAGHGKAVGFVPEPGRSAPRHGRMRRP